MDSTSRTHLHVSIYKYFQQMSENLKSRNYIDKSLECQLVLDALKTFLPEVAQYDSISQQTYNNYHEKKQLTELEIRFVEHPMLEQKVAYLQFQEVKKKTNLLTTTLKKNNHNRHMLPQSDVTVDEISELLDERSEVVRNESSMTQMGKRKYNSIERTTKEIIPSNISQPKQEEPKQQLQQQQDQNDHPQTFPEGTYYYDGKVYDVPKNFEFPKNVKLKNGLRFWLCGSSSPDTLDTMKPYRFMERRKLPTPELKKTFSMRFHNIFYLLHEIPDLHIPDDSTKMLSKEIDRVYDRFIELLKKKVSYVFNLHKDPAAKLCTTSWSRYIRRTSIIKNGTVADISQLQPPFLCPQKLEENTETTYQKKKLESLDKETEKFLQDRNINLLLFREK